MSPKTVIPTEAKKSRSEFFAEWRDLVLNSRRKSYGALFRFTLVLALSTGVSLAATEKPDTRFQWSYDKFAAQCGFTWADYHKAHSDFFTDHDYSDKWVVITPAKFKTCEDCFRSAEVTKVKGVQVAQLTLDNESGDWMYYISYCFDPSGKLQAVTTDFNCAYGWSLVRVYSFDGASLKLLEEKWQDLDSGNKIARPDTAAEMEHHWSDLAVYKTGSELPFSRLIQN